MSDSFTEDPARLAENGSAVESALLRSWSTRQPSPEARQKTLLALGVGGLLLSGGATTSAGGIGAAGAKASASVAPKALWVSASLLKWLALGVGAAATVGVVGIVASERRSSQARPAVSVSTRVAPVEPGMNDTTVVRSSTEVPRSARASAPQGQTAPEASDPGTSKLATATDKTQRKERKTVGGTGPTVMQTGPGASGTSGTDATASTVASNKEPTVTSPRAASSLPEEVLAVDRARRALARANATGATDALELLDAYDAKYPRGRVTPRINRASD